MRLLLTSSGSGSGSGGGGGATFVLTHSEPGLAA